MQVATWTGIATIRTIFLVNAAALVVAFAVRRRSATPSGSRSFAATFVLYLAAAAAMALLVLVVNLVHPLQAADPYHLERVAQIQRLGTLAYDPANVDQKVNVLGWTYELVLADVDQTPLDRARAAACARIVRVGVVSAGHCRSADVVWRRPPLVPRRSVRRPGRVPPVRAGEERSVRRGAGDRRAGVARRAWTRGDLA
jgi:hypothetical protein